jgi:deoxyribodipyrimidine photo-lyase
MNHISLVWLRRDLRLHDHVPLHAALQASHPVQLVFVFDTDILAHFPNPNDRRVRFLAHTLCHLHQQLQARGGGLLVLHGRATEIMPKLAHALSVATVHVGEDFEPQPIARDAAVKSALPAGTTMQQHVDHVTLPPYAVLKDNGEPFKVFTPYYKKWLSKLTPMSAAEYAIDDAGRYAAYTQIRAQAEASGIHVLQPEQGAAAMLEAIGYRDNAEPLWNVTQVRERLQNFIGSKLRAYPTARDMLAGQGTSQISPYLRFGLVSVRECMREAQAQGGGEKWMNELCWREFYMAILYHFPHSAHTEFMAQYRALVWHDNPEHFAAFCEGRTGYPVVDAAIRELLSTGWMHNRARMIVASFLTKDLFIDWRKGEAFFAQHLMDYELSSNAGGWQWAASTGTDAAPYFRVFNPILQSKKFDAEGVYIKTYVPELHGMDARDIHAPWESLMRPKEYPLPIVDHKTAKDYAVAAFRALGFKMGGELP